MLARVSRVLVEKNISMMFSQTSVGIWRGGGVKGSTSTLGMNGVFMREGIASATGGTLSGR